MRHRSALHVTAVLLAAWLSGCATTPGDRPGATSGPVSWEIVDITQALRSDGRGTRWDYSIVLKETRGTAILFEKRETVMLGQNVNSAPHVVPYRERLGPNSQIKLQTFSTFTFTASVQSGFGGIPLDRVLTMVIRFSGKDDNGRPISFDVRVPLDRGTGRRLIAPAVAPGPASLPRVPVSTVGALTGEWSGHYRNPDGYDLPLKLTIKDDGSFQAIEGDPARNRYSGTISVRDGQVLWSQRTSSGPLTLHEEGGKRILAGRVLITSGSQPLNYDIRVVESKPAMVSPASETPRVATPTSIAAPTPTLAPPVSSRAGSPAVTAPEARTASGLTIAFRYPPDQGRVTDAATAVVADISSDRGLATVGVSVNGARVYEQNESGAKAVPLNVPISLREGANVIVVSATEAGGGVRQEVRTVTYQLAAGIRVSYRVHGSAMNLNLKYRSPDGRTEQKKVLLPIDAAWELLFSAREGDTLEVTAQNAGEAGWVTCEIVVEGTAIAARTEEGREPTVTCKGIVTPPR